MPPLMISESGCPSLIWLLPGFTFKFSEVFHTIAASAGAGILAGLYLSLPYLGRVVDGVHNVYGDSFF